MGRTDDHESGERVDDFGSSAAPHDPLVGDRLGRCWLEARIGQGGMGVVYRARHEGLERTVAVKVLAPRLGERDESILRFLREARSMARVNHANVLRIHDVFTEGALHAIVMEHCPGLDLGDRLRQEGPIDLTRAIEIVLGACRGLEALHRQGLVHRDIKPDNLMFDADGTVRVMDFSLAREVEADRDLTRSSEILGTPHYMSPEQCTGARLDARSDIYSLGCTFYEILSGTRPFGGEASIDVVMQHLVSEPVPVHRVVSGLSPRVSRVVARMMARRAGARYADCLELEGDLLRLARGDEPHAPPLPAGPARRRLALAVGGVFLLGTAAVLLPGLLGVDRSAPSVPETLSSPDEGTGDPAPGTPSRGPALLWRVWAVQVDDPAGYDAFLEIVEAEFLRVSDPEGLAELERLRGAVEAQRNRWARDWFGQRRADFGAEIEAGRFDEAEAILDEFPVHFASTEVAGWIGESRRTIEALRVLADDRRAHQLRRFAAAQESGELARALAILEETPEALPGWIDDPERLEYLRAMRLEIDRLWALERELFQRALDGGDLAVARDVLAGMERLIVPGVADEHAALGRSLEKARRFALRVETGRDLEEGLGRIAGALRAGEFARALAFADDLGSDPRLAEFSDLRQRLRRHRRLVERSARVVEALGATIDRLVEVGASRSLSLEGLGRVEARFVGRPTPDRVSLEITVEREGSRVSVGREVSLAALEPIDLADLARESLGPTGAALALTAYWLGQGRPGVAAPFLEEIPDGAVADDAGYYREWIEADRARVLLDRARAQAEEGEIGGAWRLLAEARLLRPDDANLERAREDLRERFEARYVEDPRGGPFLRRRLVVEESFASAAGERWAWAGEGLSWPEGGTLAIDTRGGERGVVGRFGPERLDDFAISIDLALLSAGPGQGGGFHLHLADRGAGEPERIVLAVIGRDGFYRSTIFPGGPVVLPVLPIVPPLPIGREVRLEANRIGSVLHHRIDGVPIGRVDDAGRGPAEVGLYFSEGVEAVVRRVRIDRLEIER